MILKIRDIFSLHFIDRIYKFLIFHDLIITLFPKKKRKYINNIIKKQDEYLKSLKDKDKITVAFFMQTPTSWRYDNVYQTLKKDDRFNPIVVITTYNYLLHYKKSERLKVMQEAENYAKSKEYNYFNAYDKKLKKWIDVKQILNPDIVFFSKPFKDTLPIYHIYHYADRLTCYAAYGVTCIDNFYNNYNLTFHNLLWKFFIETEFQQNDAKKYSLRKGENTEVVGAIGNESIIDKNYKAVDTWKIKDKIKKRIIWAPHHSIQSTESLNLSTFLWYSDFFFEMAKKYEDKIQIAFKPHPLLKFKLINLWGKKETENYYEKWTNFSNTQIHDENYIDLFLTSDAIIHDSVSFTVEYLYTKKPALFCLKNDEVKQLWDKTELGTSVLKLHYFAKNNIDIENFINDVVLNENDLLKKERESFYTNYLYPNDDIMPSQKIKECIKNNIATSPII